MKTASSRSRGPGTQPAPLVWPEGKRFAFTIFDDTDSATLENVPPIYALLDELGFRTTKSVWPLRGSGQGIWPGDTCQDPEYLGWLLELQAKGFEIGYHLATCDTSSRAQTREALDLFRKCFGHDPMTAANHADCLEGMYWGDARLTGLPRAVYNVLTRFRYHRKFLGHMEGSDLFWGDLCRERIRFMRNFVFPDTDTLACGARIPYVDADRPFVNGWFSSSDGHDLGTALACLSEANQDALEAAGGACILYAHLGHGFLEGGRPHPEFERLMRRLATKDGWFVPVHTLLEHLERNQGPSVLTARGATPSGVALAAGQDPSWRIHLASPSASLGATRPSAWSPPRRVAAADPLSRHRGAGLATTKAAELAAGSLGRIDSAVWVGSSARGTGASCEGGAPEEARTPASGPGQGPPSGSLPCVPMGAARNPLQDAMK